MRSTRWEESQEGMAPNWTASTFLNTGQASRDRGRERLGITGSGCLEAEEDMGMGARGQEDTGALTSSVPVSEAGEARQEESTTAEGQLSEAAGRGVLHSRV